MLTGAEIVSIFSDPFPYILKKNGRSVLFRSPTDPPMVIGQTQEVFLLAKYAERPDIQKDIWISLMRIRWPEGVESSDIITLEELLDKVTAQGRA